MRLFRLILPLAIALLAAAPSAQSRDLGDMSSTEIRALQQRLTDGGVITGAIDGQASPSLEAAIKACPSQDPVLRIETGMHAAVIYTHRRRPRLPIASDRVLGQDCAVVVAARGAAAQDPEVADRSGQRRQGLCGRGLAGRQAGGGRRMGCAPDEPATHERLSVRYRQRRPEGACGRLRGA